MGSKIISLPIPKRQKLSRLMLVALVEAGVRQKQGIPFGPVDIKNAGLLIKRGLVVIKDVTIKNHTQSSWQVTPEAFEILKSMGVDLVI